MNIPHPIEMLEAPPLQIPQIELRWYIPTSWRNFVRKGDVNLAREIDDFLTGWPGRIEGIRLKEGFLESFQPILMEHESQVIEAMKGEIEYVTTTERRELALLLVEAAEGLGKSPHLLLHVLLARVMKFHGALSESSVVMAQKTSRRLAAAPAAPGKILSGPWMKKAIRKTNLQSAK